jgi:uncharacterized protein
MDGAERFREGLNFFNAGRYFDAHEAWEDVWRSTEPGPLRCFYQGLIQAAVALLHLERGNVLGARSQLGKAIRNLEQNLSEGSAVDGEGLVQQLRTVQREMRADKVQIRATKLW